MANLTGKSLGRYHIVEPLGEGGMASVYKAYDTNLERDVAVKVIRREAFSPEVVDRMLERFGREAKALSKLTHSNIVPIIDYGNEEGSPYLVMPLIKGGTLKDHLLKKTFGVGEAARLLAPIARALDYAHSHGILHRDVKPGNILITDSGDPLLSDFGVAKILEEGDSSTLTGTGVGLGTPEFMAPEQWVGKASAASDQYSLGVVFFEMVTGHKPYTADTPAAVLLKQANEPLPRPRDFVSDLPDEVEKVLFKCLAKKPEDRYASMAEFASALNVLEGGTRERIVAAPVAIEDEGTIVGGAMPTIAQVTPPPAAPPKLDKADLPKPPAKPGKPIKLISPQAPKKKNLLPLVLGGVGLVAVVLAALAIFVWLPGSKPQTPTQRVATQPVKTSAPATQQPVAALPVTGNLTIWMAYAADSHEGLAFLKAAERAKAEYPDVKIEVIGTPDGNVIDKYWKSLETASGPDLIMASNDQLLGMVEQGVVLDISSVAGNRLEGFNKTSLEGMNINGKIWGIPESLKAVTLWYNKSLLAKPPATVNELQTLMQNGTEVAISYNCYYYYGFYGAFGGTVFDNNWKIIAGSNTGMINAMEYLSELFKISRARSWPTETGPGVTDFVNGKAAAITDGNWSLPFFKNMLGDKLGVAALPGGVVYPNLPILGVDGIFVNPASKNIDAAIEIAFFLTNRESQTIMMNEAGHVPARMDVEITDPLMIDLAAAINKGFTPRPQVPQLNNYWMNFCDSYGVLNGDIPVADWLKNQSDQANR